MIIRLNISQVRLIFDGPICWLVNKMYLTERVTMWKM